MSGPIFLEGDKVNLRTYEREDIEFVRDAYNSEEVWGEMFDRRPFNLEELEQGFENSLEDDKIRLMISSEEDSVGIIYTNKISRDHGQAEIGVWISANHQGKGYGKEAVRIFSEYLINQVRIHKVSAKVLEFNEASKNMLKSLGFQKEATLKEEKYANGTYQDLAYYSITENEWRNQK